MKTIKPKIIKINHIAKIEGHASFLGKLMDGRIEEAKIETEEGARLIEGILLGRKFSDAPVITSRICGICPVVHNLCSIKAMEDALGIKVTEPVVILRKLMKYGEIIHSHGLHFFWLSLPDFYKIKNDLTLIKKNPKETTMAVQVREYGIDLVKVIGGRTVHPMASEIGGFKRFPTKEEMKSLLNNYDKSMTAIWYLVHFFKKLKYPELVNKKEFISQGSDTEYSVYDGGLVSDQGLKMSVREFYKNIQERTYDEAGAELVKRAKFKDKHYMVGALARINNNHKHLNKEAKKVLADLKLKTPISNSFYNILAQVVEVAHLIEESKKLIEQYLKLKKEPVNTPYKLKAGFGVAEVEAPRGMLFHAYELDKTGQIVNCNIISPTDQLLDVIEDDIKELKLKGLKTAEQKDLIKFLIRAYDPCISCATH
jgi:coenzyme F420-reducing hydrogenase alpha subunit